MSEVGRARREAFDLKASGMNSAVPPAKTGLSRPGSGSRLASRSQFPPLQQSRDVRFRGWHIPTSCPLDRLQGGKFAQFEMPDFGKLDPTSAEKSGPRSKTWCSEDLPGHEARADEGCTGQLRRRFVAPALEGGDGLQGHHWSEPAENLGFVLQPLTIVLIVWSTRQLGTPPAVKPGHRPPAMAPQTPRPPTTFSTPPSPAVRLD